MRRIQLGDSRDSASITLLTLALGLWIGLVTIGAGEPPSTPSAAEDSAGKPRTSAEQRIRDALNGQPSPGPTGEGVLDDVLQIIKQRRSILRGSSLDPINRVSESSAGPPTVSEMAAVAEQLLRAARLLEKVGGPDQDRAELVQRMRAEAVRLLTE